MSAGLSTSSQSNQMSACTPVKTAGLDKVVQSTQ